MGSYYKGKPYKETPSAASTNVNKKFDGTKNDSFTKPHNPYKKLDNFDSPLMEELFYLFSEKIKKLYGKETWFTFSRDEKRKMFKAHLAGNMSENEILHAFEINKTD
ncbi:MAG: hypothetical protein WC476_01000 [Phycisphaerae bacterium]|jgi:hypothetical protein